MGFLPSDLKLCLLCLLGTIITYFLTSAKINRKQTFPLTSPASRLLHLMLPLPKFLYVHLRGHLAEMSPHREAFLGYPSWNCLVCLLFLLILSLLRIFYSLTEKIICVYCPSGSMRARTVSCTYLSKLWLRLTRATHRMERHRETPCVRLRGSARSLLAPASPMPENSVIPTHTWPRGWQGQRVCIP